MSDLAPFVAAVLRDKTIADLLDELKAERKRNQELQDELRTIRITGPGGFPVYAERHFQFATKDCGAGYWELELKNGSGGEPHLVNPELARCPIQEAESCEVHIGGKEILVMSEFDDTDANSIFGDSNCILEYMFQPLEDGRHNITVTFEFGPNPFPLEPYILAPQIYKEEDIEYVRFTKFEVITHPFEKHPIEC